MGPSTNTGVCPCPSCCRFLLSVRKAGVARVLMQGEGKSPPLVNSVRGLSPGGDERPAWRSFNSLHGRWPSLSWVFVCELCHLLTSVTGYPGGVLIVLKHQSLKYIKRSAIKIDKNRVPGHSLCKKIKI